MTLWDLNRFCAYQTALESPMVQAAVPSEATLEVGEVVGFDRQTVAEEVLVTRVQMVPV